MSDDEKGKKPKDKPDMDDWDNPRATTTQLEKAQKKKKNK